MRGMRREIAKKRRFLVQKKQALLLLGLFLLFFGLYRYSRPIDPPAVATVLEIQDESKAPIDIVWPAAAQASVGTVEDGILASETNQKVWPAASTAKIIAALTILKEKPLAPGEAGPTLTIDEQDMRLYDDYFRAGGSLVEVELGQQLTQYQMLQGILIRSGNNLADGLAVWAFGSLSEYQIAAQKLVDELGMTNTTVGTDASGLSTTTTTTAEDLTKLAIAAMKHDVVREIVRQPSSNFPGDGAKPSTNWMLGQNGVVGIKTGSLPSVGGVFMIASEFAPDGGAPVTVVGAVQGAPTTYSAIANAGALAEKVKSLFVEKTLVEKGTVIATISTPWGETSDVVAASDITTFGWRYEKAEPEIMLDSTAPFQASDVLGSITVNGEKSDLIATDAIAQPSWQWRLLTSR